MDVATCPHVDRDDDGRCRACGDCAHEVILNGACLACGSTDLDPVARSPRPELVPASALVRRRPPR
ncbi:MAG: hypothetical protein IPL61_18240 [Myxococcales bacterium]|nr:hypothetical protein [Myxococcales bacterium]